MDLIYRGSDSDFSKECYFKVCENKDNTIGFVQTTDGEVFGGYTSYPIKDTGGIAIDSKAFLFSITHQQKYAVRMNNHSAALIYNDNMFPFGDAIGIKNQCHTKTDNYVRFAGKDRNSYQ